MARRKSNEEIVIKTVSFRGNIAVGEERSFQHVHVEATADVPKGDDPTRVLEALKEFVARELKVARHGASPRPVQAPIVRLPFADRIR